MIVGLSDKVAVIIGCCVVLFFIVLNMRKG